jgi:hypothetical protein
VLKHGWRSEKTRRPRLRSRRGTARASGATCHVHQRHVADDRIEVLLSKGNQCLLVRGIHHNVPERLALILRPGPGSLEHARCKVGGDDAGSERNQAPRQLAIAAGHFEYPVAVLHVEEVLDGGGDEHTVPFIAVTHSLVPEAGVLVPHRTHLLVCVWC